ARWIHFSSAQLGWAIIGNYRLVRTTDGGLHWTAAGPPRRRGRKHG
ncbi:MAG: Photosynthesis system assembly factor, partial [Gaiellaceae bacterium]|nr:Photosynthesis system assembly factor [Gaiellaceae bacterium]